MPVDTLDAFALGSQERRAKKSPKSEKKRSREEDRVADSERNHKKSKRRSASGNAASDHEEVNNRMKKSKDSQMTGSQKSKDSQISGSQKSKDSQMTSSQKSKDNQMTSSQKSKGSQMTGSQKRENLIHHYDKYIDSDDSAASIYDEPTDKQKKSKAVEIPDSQISREVKPSKKKKHIQGDHKAERNKKVSKKAESDGDASDSDAESVIALTQLQVEDDSDASLTQSQLEDDSEVAMTQSQLDDDSEADLTQSQSEADFYRTGVHAMDIDEPAYSSSSNLYQPPDIPNEPQFPFFSQTVSLFEPIYPIGWAQPVTHCDFYFLRRYLNKYVPSLRGVLIGYKNVALGDKPGVGVAQDDAGTIVFKSRREYGVGWGWITADVDLFVPTRGAWMEGSINLQTEGHIGVVCFGKFNASIEARRLPRSWQWVPSDDQEAESGIEETADFMAPDEHGAVQQIHSTGFWVDANGDKVRGKTRFRIRNYDVGISGETTYLSLEGTMLDKASEKVLVQQEAEANKKRRELKDGERVDRRRAPEFSTTRFFSEEAKEKKKVYEKRKYKPKAKSMPRPKSAVAAAAVVASSQGTKTVFDD